MSDQHDVGPELRQLARTVLGLVDPFVQAGAAAVASLAEADGPAKCSQVWCPLCAAAAVAAGESHPLASMVVQHGAALLEQLRAAARDDPGAPRDDAGVDDADPMADARGRYQPIPVVVQDD